MTFEENGINAMENGSPRIPLLTQYTSEPEAFSEGYRPFAYIIHPTESGHVDYERVYRDRMGRLVPSFRRLFQGSKAHHFHANTPA
jgi:hypothetical protein